MKRGLLPGLALLTTIVATPVTAAECDSVCMLGQVEHYFKALDRVSRRGATVDDVDLLLALLHPAVRYVHVEYEADFGRAEWRQAFIGNLERGAYANGPENEIRVLKSIPGKNHLAVEYVADLSCNSRTRRAAVMPRGACSPGSQVAKSEPPPTPARPSPA